MLKTRSILFTGLLLLAGGVVVAGGNGPDIDLDTIRAIRPLLRQGELVLMSSNKDGTPDEATAMATINAPADVVWETLLDYRRYPDFLPRVSKAKVVRVKGKTHDVAYEVEVPGPNYHYTIRCTKDKSAYTLNSRWLSGDLKGGRWAWKLYPMGNRTIATYTAHTDVSTANYLIREFDDKYHTFAFGLDVSASVLAVKAMKAESERRAKKANPKKSGEKGPVRRF